MGSAICPEDFRLIRALIPDGNIRISTVGGGVSPAGKYHVEAEGRVWMCKCFQTKPRIAEWYTLVKEAGCPQLASAEKWLEDEAGRICVLAPWIDGTELGTYLLSHPERTEECGLAAGRLLRRLHQIPLTGVAGVPDGKMSLLHNDLKPEHFIFRDGRPYLVDFENGGVGDPEADIRRFEKRIPKTMNAFFVAFLAGYGDQYVQNDQ